MDMKLNFETLYISVALQIKFVERWNVERESVGLRQLTKIHLVYSVNVSLDGNKSKWTLNIQTSFLHYHVSFPNVNFTLFFLEYLFAIIILLCSLHEKFNQNHNL